MSSFLLLQTGDYLLLQGGGKIILASGGTPGRAAGGSGPYPAYRGLILECAAAIRMVFDLTAEAVRITPVSAGVLVSAPTLYAQSNRIAVQQKECRVQVKLGAKIEVPRVTHALAAAAKAQSETDVMGQVLSAEFIAQRRDLVKLKAETEELQELQIILRMLD